MFSICSSCSIVSSTMISTALIKKKYAVSDSIELNSNNNYINDQWSSVLPRAFKPACPFEKTTESHQVWKDPHHAWNFVVFF